MADRAGDRPKLCLLDDEPTAVIPKGMQLQRHALESAAQRGIGALQRGDFHAARDAFSQQ